MPDTIREPAIREAERTSAARLRDRIQVAAKVRSAIVANQVIAT